MLTIEYKPGDTPEKDQIEVYCDLNGLDIFIRKLEVLKRNGGHVHLMTEEWAGQELTSDPQGEGTIIINHMAIMLAPQSERTIK